MAEIYRGKSDTSSSDQGTRSTGRMLAILLVVIAVAVIALAIWGAR